MKKVFMAIVVMIANFAVMTAAPSKVGYSDVRRSAFEIQVPDRVRVEEGSSLERMDPRELLNSSRNGTLAVGDWSGDGSIKLIRLGDDGMPNADAVLADGIGRVIEMVSTSDASGTIVYASIERATYEYALLRVTVDSKGWINQQFFECPFSDALLTGRDECLYTGAIGYTLNEHTPLVPRRIRQGIWYPSMDKYISLGHGSISMSQNSDFVYSLDPLQGILRAPITRAGKYRWDQAALVNDQYPYAAAIAVEDNLVAVLVTPWISPSSEIVLLREESGAGLAEIDRLTDGDLEFADFYWNQAMVINHGMIYVASSTNSRLLLCKNSENGRLSKPVVAYEGGYYVGATVIKPN